MSFSSTLRALCFQRHLFNRSTVCRISNIQNIFLKRNFVTLNSPRSVTLITPLPCQCDFSRGYAKGKDKKKSDSKGKKKVTINDEELAQIIQIDTMKTQMQKSIDVLRDEYIKNLSLRSSAGSIETLRVKLDGQEHTLQELAQVVRKNPKTIVINMTAFPQAIPNVLQAIQQSGMNLNPQQDGTTLFVPVPVVTREHRENLAKNAKALFIRCRDTVKDVQNKFHKAAKKRTDVSMDEVFAAQQQITTIADQYISQAEKMLQAKQTELLGKE